MQINTTEPSPIIINGLFIIPVIELCERYRFNNEEMEHIKTQTIILNKHNYVSEKSYILNHEKMKNIKTFIEKGIKYYTEEILCPSNKDVELYITESWCNYTTKGQSHHRHNHSNGIISGVLYIDVDKDNDKIHFYNKTYDRIDIPVDENKFNNYNSTAWWLPVENGKLILFNSSLEHSVEEIKSNHIRVSISFNTFIKGEIGTHTTFLKLHG